MLVEEASWQKKSHAYPIEADESGELARLKLVQHADELSRVDGIAGGVEEAGVDAELQELGDDVSLGRRHRL